VAGLLPPPSHQRPWRFIDSALHVPDAKVASLLGAVSSMAPLPRVPDLLAQRAAMKKLSFLIGNWSGEARLQRRPGELLELVQTESVQYKLDGLVLVIEGTGRSKSDGQVALQALAIVFYDDEAGVYRMHAYNDGRYLETQLKPAEGSGSLAWGFSLGDIKTRSVLRITETGEWTELAEISIGSQPPRQLMELRVRPQK
jgi:hypothetical protein